MLLQLGACENNPDHYLIIPQSDSLRFSNFILFINFVYLSICLFYLFLFYFICGFRFYMIYCFWCYCFTYIQKYWTLWFFIQTDDSSWLCNSRKPTYRSLRWTNTCAFTASNDTHIHTVAPHANTHYILHSGRNFSYPVSL